MSKTSPINRVEAASGASLITVADRAKRTRELAALPTLGGEGGLHPPLAVQATAEVVTCQQPDRADLVPISSR